MIRLIFEMQKQKRFIIQGIITFILFLTLYFLLDRLNMTYPEMIAEYGWLLVAANVTLNILMAAISAIMLNFSTALVKFSGKEGKGTFLSSIAVLFGMLTYGCTPCVIAFFATIGITFSVLALPLAGFPYKLISLGILLLGSIWLLYEIQHSKCKVPKIQPEIQE